MYLKELTINGFKSFAKKSELEFSVPITAIVGPNGSGKSNIAESFRFVLGEQSVKSMRGKRGEDLIWGGSEKVSRGNRASVELVFDNTARVLPLDFEEVHIERIVHRDGQNEYKLNGSTVRLKDVHELLASANIGSTGHHIISQGEADRVLSAGAAERREIIEDALGLKVYQLKKHEAERKLDRTRENITQVESLRREAAPHLKYLKKQVERAERSLEIQKELRTKYAEYLKREDVYVAFHHDRLVQERREPEKKLREVVDRLAAVKELLAKVEVDTETKPKSDDEAAIAYREATLARQEADRVLNQLEGQIGYLERRLTQKKEVKPRPLIARAELEALITEIELSTEQTLHTDDSDALKEALRNLVARLRSFVEQAEETVVDTSEADRIELERLGKERGERAVEAMRAAENEGRLREVYEAAQSSRVEESHKQREVERELFALQNERREIELKLAALDREAGLLDRDRADFKQQLQEAVALLGRGAADYYQLQVLAENGEQLSETDIAAEERTKQRERAHELEKLKIRLEELGVGATDELLKEYQDAKERDEFLVHELSDLEASVKNLGELIADLEEKLGEQFTVGVEQITKEFQNFFTLMFGGGSAKLELVKLKSRKDGDEEAEETVRQGVELSVSLPNKRVKGLEMLSGGERALTSIALIFAMSQVNPPPFIILDETDAALDEANSRRYGDMIEALAKKSQLLLITHNRETMSRAGILYGITMSGDGVSKVLSVKFDEAAAVAK
jgi:chromosome segregation ATPase